MNNKISKILVAISILMLLLAIADVLSSDYYVLLRFIVCATAIYFVFKSKALRKKGWMWMMIVIAILFNPLLPVRLNKVDFVFVDIITICFFMTSLVKIKDDKKTLKLNMTVIKVVLGLLFFTIIISIALYRYFLAQKYLP